MKYKSLSDRERLDDLVEDLVICEPKAKDEMNAVWKAQVFKAFKVIRQAYWFFNQF